MFKKVLIPYDASEHSKRAVDTAINLFSEKKGVEFGIIHVMSPIPEIYQAQISRLDVDLNAVVINSGQEIIQEAKKQLESAGFLVKEYIEIGNPAQEICRIAHEFNYEMIIMGSRGLGQFKEFFLGSVSHQIIQHSKLPVLIVK